MTITSRRFGQSFHGEPCFLHRYWGVPFAITYGDEPIPEPPHSPPLLWLERFPHTFVHFGAWMPECYREDCYVCPRQCKEAAEAGAEYLKLVLGYQQP